MNSRSRQPIAKFLFAFFAWAALLSSVGICSSAFFLRRHLRRHSFSSCSFSFRKKLCESTENVVSMWPIEFDGTSANRNVWFQISLLVNLDAFIHFSEFSQWMIYDNLCSVLISTSISPSSFTIRMNEKKSSEKKTDQKYFTRIHRHERQRTQETMRWEQKTHHVIRCFLPFQFLVSWTPGGLYLLDYAFKKDSGFYW